MHPSAPEEAIVHLRSGLTLLSAVPDSPRRARLELELVLALNTPLVFTRGFASAEQVHVHERARLGEVYGWFTEGFDMPDLVEARALLAELERKALDSDNHLFAGAT